mmetsp:Transcript_12165/g.20506  ORF Transcript_12165/g.20506 Transcript_12165/m.20506 type:complete len:93 (-) Transcript_12165:1258-1536(-)
MDFSDSTEELDFKDIWNNKNSDDFLRYLKFEAYNFGFIMTHLLMGFIIFGTFFNSRHGQISHYVIGIMASLSILRLLTIEVLSRQFRVGRIF